LTQGVGISVAGSLIDHLAIGKNLQAGVAGPAILEGLEEELIDAGGIAEVGAGACLGRILCWFLAKFRGLCWGRVWGWLRGWLRSWMRG
jgi:hypothetical protein